MSKTVNFNLDNNKIHTAYSVTEYNRSQIDSVFNRIVTRKIPNTELIKIFSTLNFYKLTEMIIHKNSLGNTKLH